MKTINSLPPFKRFCVTIGNLPSSYVDSMSYYECLMWLCKYLKDTVIPAVNENAEAVNELINWFNNLDVQDEIDKKLDEMAESGELEEIIASYLNVNSILAFNTKADMKNADNLVNGSFVRTYGTNTYNDGLGNYYKIRTMTSGDVVDDVNIIALSVSDTLIAELINDYTIKKYLVGVNKQFTGKVCFFSDSYGNATTCPVNWVDELKTLLNADELLSVRWNGSGFLGRGGAPTWPNQLQSIVNQTTQLQRDEVSALIIGGGFNDRGYTETQILNAMESFNTIAKTNFPNATIYLACMGWTSDNTTTDINIDGGYIYNLQVVLPTYSQCGKFGWKFLTNVEWVMHDLSNFQNDKVHPNEKGSRELASAMYSAINGSADVHKDWRTLDGTITGNFDAYTGGKPKTRLDNGVISIMLTTSEVSLYATSSSKTYNQNTFYPILNVTDGFGVGDQYRQQMKPATIYYDPDLKPLNVLIGYTNGKFGFVPFSTISTTDIRLPKATIEINASQV